MVGQMIYRDECYIHPEHAEISTLEDGSSTLLQMFSNAVRRNSSSDFLGKIDVEQSQVEYDTYGQVFEDCVTVGDYLWMLTTEHAEALKQELEMLSECCKISLDNLHTRCTKSDCSKNLKLISRDREAYLNQKYGQLSQKLRISRDISNGNDKGADSTSFSRVKNAIDPSTDSRNVVLKEKKYKDTRYEAEIDGTEGVKELVGIFSVNRPEWIVSEYATYLSNTTNCPLYSTFGSESLKHILSETRMRICFASRSKAESLYNDVISNTKTSLRHLICFDDLSTDFQSLFEKEGVSVHHFSQILNNGGNRSILSKSIANNHRAAKYEILENEKYIVPKNDLESESSSEEIVRNRNMRNDNEHCDKIANPNNIFDNQVESSQLNDKRISCINDRGVIDENYPYIRKEDSMLKSKNSTSDDDVEINSTMHNDTQKKRVYIKDTFPWIDPSDTATVCYTSGTSGNPKGVLLSHSNFISVAAGFLRVKGTRDQFKIGRGDTHLSYLPLAHVMERVCVLVFTSCAARICFFRGDPKCLQSDMKISRPTFLVGVPRVFNVFYERINFEVSKRGALVRAIFNTCVSIKIFLQRFGIYKAFGIDQIVFKKVREQFGGSLRAGMNGSAPLSKETCSYVQAVLSMRIVQGYGQTEATAANLLTNIGDYSNDRVGIPFPTNKVKLHSDESEVSKHFTSQQAPEKITASVYSTTNIGKTDVIEEIKSRDLNIINNDSKNRNFDEITNGAPNKSINLTVFSKKSKANVTRGEILLKGPNITKGYYRRPDLTKDLFTKDGWLRTGDIAEIDTSSKVKAFKIVGRRKEIFKTSLGEYIVPEKIENVMRCNILEDILVTGKSTGDFIVAIVVCKNKNHSKEYIQQIIQTRGNKLVGENVLTKFEIPRKILLIRQDFDTLGEFLTPTLKKKRHKIEEYFKTQIDELYNK